jgi:hypothetical protein
LQFLQALQVPLLLQVASSLQQLAANFFPAIELLDEALVPLLQPIVARQTERIIIVIEVFMCYSLGFQKMQGNSSKLRQFRQRHTV